MIRKISDTDKQIYFEMSKEFYSSGAAKGEITDGQREKFFPLILDDTFVHGYIIESKGEIAGYALTVPYASQEFGGVVLWVDELFIKDKFRGRGLGKEFLKFAENQNCVLLRLEAEKDNLRALSLYERNGFEALEYLQLIKRK